MDELKNGKHERIMNMSPAGDCNFPSYYVITIIITFSIVAYHRKNHSHQNCCLHSSPILHGVCLQKQITGPL